MKPSLTILTPRAYRRWLDLMASGEPINTDRIATALRITHAFADRLLHEWTEYRTIVTDARSGS